MSLAPQRSTSSGGPISYKARLRVDLQVRLGLLSPSRRLGLGSANWLSGVDALCIIPMPAFAFGFIIFRVFVLRLFAKLRRACGEEKSSSSAILSPRPFRHKTNPPLLVDLAKHSGHEV